MEDENMAKRKVIVRRETVTRVIDGDTFRTSSRKNAIRLANVNAPEKRARGSTRATQELRKLIQGKKVEVNTIARDSYGRAVANVRVEGKSVNRAMNRKLKK